MPLHTEIVHSATGLIYRIRRGQPQQPLILLLHGLSGDENAMWIFDHALPRAATVIAPRALYPSAFGGYSWSRSVDRDDLDHVDYGEALEVLTRFVPEVLELYQGDPQRMMVIGFSQGAALSYAFSVAHPELMRGIIALAGFLPQAVAHQIATAQTALPRYLIIHGTHDEEVPLARAREARSVLENRGAIVEYHEHRVGHKVSAQGLKEIARWLQPLLL